MIPTAFDQENGTIDPPKGMSYDQCTALSVFRGLASTGVPVVISCWKFTAAELSEMRRTGRLWVMVRGRTMPPIIPLGISPWSEQSWSDTGQDRLE